MKNLLFGLLATVCMVFSANAQQGDKKESATMKIKMADSNTSYKFSSIKDFEANSDKALETIKPFSETAKAEECTVTVEMSVSVTVNAGIGVVGGEVTTTVTGTITASCKDIKAAALRLRAQLIAIAQGQ